MTVIRPNSIAGINSITAQSNTIGFFKSDGTTLGVTLTGINLSNINELNVSGVSTLSGGVNVTGVSTFNDNVKLLDSDKLLLGTGEDLEIYHDGSNSYIVDKGTGGLVLGGNFVAIRKDDLVESQIIGFSDAQVQLYYDGSEKLATTASGITVTGGVNASQGIDAASLRVTGITTLGNATATTLVVSGVSTVGVVTGATSIQATNFYGSGANLTGVAATSNISTNALVNSGVTTTSGLVVSGVTTTGLVVPAADNTHNLGSSSFRWANIFSADLQLSNEGSINDIDGTWGKYTIQEGENNLFLINRRTGKQYKFVLEEVN